MRITWFGHSTFRLDFGSTALMIDPFLTGNPAFAGDPEAAAAGVTHVAVTHGHADHVGDAVAISKRTGAPVATNFDLCMWLAKTAGLEKMQPMNTGGQVDLGECSVALTIAFHSSGQLDEMGNSQALGLPNGVVVTPKDKAQPVVYHMGDTDIFSDMGLIGELYDPAVVMVPVGDRFTMGGRLAAEAVRRFLPRAKVVIPCHYGTFPIIDATPDAFLRHMGEERGRVRVPEKGVAFEV
ncbi:metal-dependent hydrolase [Falsiroseomonas sp. CW058]|uniref:metal-dependent hydrolase n=1 Tax=Falsiroseomonas sp. CW058 TaxID=3388664 RepID=UPI003D323CC2